MSDRLQQRANGESPTVRHAGRFAVVAQAGHNVEIRGRFSTVLTLTPYEVRALGEALVAVADIAEPDPLLEMYRQAANEPPEPVHPDP